MQWLRDGLGLIAKASDVDALATRADPKSEVVLVPAFVGLGAPYWDAEARGAIFGLTRQSGGAELARAALEAVGFQTRDLIDAMRADWVQSVDTVLRVDGGMTASEFTMQFSPTSSGPRSTRRDEHGARRRLSRGYAAASARTRQASRPPALGNFEPQMDGARSAKRGLARPSSVPRRGVTPDRMNERLRIRRNCSGQSNVAVIENA